MVGALVTALVGAVGVVGAVGAVIRVRLAPSRLRLIDRLEELDRTTAFARVAARHRQARQSRRLLALAVTVLVAVLATRIAAAAPSLDGSGGVSLPGDGNGNGNGIGSGNGIGIDGGAAALDGEEREEDGEPADSARLADGNVHAHAHVLPLAVSDVAAAAVRAAGLARDPVPGWNTRTRLAGLVPMLSARYGRNLTWKDVDDPTLGYTNMYDLRATWHLERLVFDPNEIRSAAIDVSRRREKRRVEILAVHRYLAWSRLPRTSDRAGLLAADLDAITDGWFSEALARRRAR